MLVTKFVQKTFIQFFTTYPLKFNISALNLSYSSAECSYGSFPVKSNQYKINPRENISDAGVKNPFGFPSSPAFKL